MLELINIEIQNCIELNENMCLLNPIVTWKHKHIPECTLQILTKSYEQKISFKTIFFHPYVAMDTIVLTNAILIYFWPLNLHNLGRDMVEERMRGGVGQVLS